MTLTLIARNPFTMQIGIAIASGSDDCVGGSLYRDAARGVVSVQAKGDRAVGARALALLQGGASSDDILDILHAEDKALSYRQVLIAPFSGGMRVMTGAQCLSWAGHIGHEHYLLAGNMLSGKDVLEAMEKAYLKDLTAPLRKRLLSALQAGVAGGGDLRGHKSAGVIVMGDTPFEYAVTENAAPVAQLAAGI
jgi:uncharacterized Ntn-hydrolase superfamily protein